MVGAVYVATSTILCLGNIFVNALFDGILQPRESIVKTMKGLAYAIIVLVIATPSYVLKTVSYIHEIHHRGFMTTFDFTPPTGHVGPDIRKQHCR